MRKLVLLVCLAGVLRAAPTTITDTIYTAFGTTFTGTVVITAPDMTTAEGNFIGRGTQSYNVAAGVFGPITLEANDLASPPNTFYTVRFRPNVGPQWTETWVVYSTIATLSISDVRTATQPMAITALNGLIQRIQTFAVGTTGTNFNISSTNGVHTFNFPNASASARGLLTSADWTLFNAKESALTFNAPLSRAGNAVSLNLSFTGNTSVIPSWTGGTGAGCVQMDSSGNIFSTGTACGTGGGEGGEVNTASNVGSLGIGLFKQKSGFDLQFYKVASANNLLTVALSGTDFLNLTVNQSNIALSALQTTSGTFDIARIPTGTTSSTVSLGNHTHAGVYEPANANIQAHISSTANPHSVTKAQVGLANVSNDAQLKIASNLSDLANTTTARSNLGLGDSATLNVGTATGTVAAGDHAHTGVYEPANANIQSHISSTSNPHSVTAAQLGLVIGTDVQGWNVNLDTVAGKTLVGTGTNLRFSTGTFATDDCVKVDANGNFSTAGAACGSGTGGLSNAYANVTDGTTTAAASGGDTFKLRTASNLLSLVVQSNDVTHGDNALFTVNEGNFTLSNLGGAVTDAQVPNTITLDNLTQVTTRNYSDLQSIPSTFAPSTHATSHQNGGADEVATATPAANVIPKAGADNKLATGFIPDLPASIITSGSFGGDRLTNPAVGVKGGVNAKLCPGTDKVSGIATDGDPVCSADQLGEAGGGITSLNSLEVASQTLAKVDDTNVTLGISSATATHTFTMGWTGTLAAGRLNANVVQGVTNDTNVTGSIGTQNLTLGWTGTLAKARQNAATVYNDAANTWSAGAQDFGAATSLKVPTGAGAAPTASGLIAYDSTANLFKVGVNAAGKTLAFTDSNITGNAATATALAANGGNCSAGNLPRGVDASGVAEGCAPVDLAAEITGVLPAASIDDGGAAATQALFSGAAGAAGFRAIADADIPNDITITHLLGLPITALAGAADDGKTITYNFASGLFEWQTHVLASTVNQPSGVAGLDAGGLISSSALPLHATSHQDGGADQIATTTPAIGAIPKAGANSMLGTGWIPDLPASIITSGAFDAARIPEAGVTQWQTSLALSAAQVTSGILAAARGGAGADTSAMNGMLKATLGVMSEVTGDPSDCVRKDGSASPCPTGGSGAPNQSLVILNGQATGTLTGATHGYGHKHLVISHCYAVATGVGIEVPPPVIDDTSFDVVLTLSEAVTGDHYCPVSGSASESSLPSYTVATLPAFGVEGRSAYVTDSLDGTCTAGTGSTVVLCRDSGTAWVAVTGAGGGGGLGDPGANGIVVRTALDTTTARSVTSSDSSVTVTNGDGTAGNIDLALPKSVHTEAFTSSASWSLTGATHGLGNSCDFVVNAWDTASGRKLTFGYDDFDCDTANGNITVGWPVATAGRLVVARGAGSGGGGGGSSAFADLTTGTNTTATMTLGAGGTLTFASTGVVNANQFNGATTIADADIASTIARDSEVATAVTNMVSAAATLTADLPMFGDGTKAAKVGTKTGTGNELVASQSPTIVTPTIASLTNAQHTHADAAGGGQLGTGALTDGAITPAKVSSALRTETKSMTLFDPVTGDSGRIQIYFPTAVTITRVACSVQAATSVTINLDERAEATPNTAGTAVLTSNLVCDTSSEVSTTFTNAGIAARVPMALTIQAVVGTPETLRVHVEYQID